MFPNLKAEMARQGITNEKLAESLGINPATMSAKLNRYDRLKYCECLKIRNSFFPGQNVEYLFAANIGANTGQHDAA